MKITIETEPDEIRRELLEYDKRKYDNGVRK